MKISFLKAAIAILLITTPIALMAQSRQEILNEARKYEPIGLSLIDLGLSSARVDNDITLLVNRILPDIIDENIRKELDQLHVTLAQNMDCLAIAAEKIFPGGRCVIDSLALPLHDLHNSR